MRDGFTSGASAVMEAPSPDGKWFASDDERDLYLRSSADGRKRRLTSDGEEDLAWSCQGASWSPDSTRLAVSRANTQGVEFWLDKQSAETP